MTDLQQRTRRCVGPTLAGLFLLHAVAVPLASAAAAEVPDGWSHTAPREEIAPKFTYDPGGGPSRGGSFVIESDGREGLIGRWTKAFPVSGGGYYRFSARRRVENVASPRRCAVARLLWRDAQGRS
ncbi:MAG: hypothetical protein HQ581_09390, partial [Planctomycetes bacterium]|nr:hypothetical protein [Planctomycetota bacterium]